MALLDDLKWRHATKAFDPRKKVSQEHIDTIVEAMRLAPTSSGLQPFRVLVIENQALKEKLTEGANQKDCMRDCSHVIVLASWDQYTGERIDKVYENIAVEREIPIDKMLRYSEKIKESFSKNSALENHAHTARQTYIALGLGLVQAAELKVDATPVEGFTNSIVDEILELNKMGLKSVLLMYLGYQDAARNYNGSMKKVRIPREEFVIEYK